MIEAAIWRAHLEAVPVERIRVLADRLRQFGHHPNMFDQTAHTARHFAWNLAGDQTDAFVDTLAILFAQA